MVTVTRRMQCSVDAVLDVVADGWSYATWVVGTSRIRGVDAAWPSPGSRIAHSAGIWPAVVDDVTVALAWDRPRGRLELQARGWPVGEARVLLRVRPDGDGCLVRLDEDAVRGPGLLAPRPLRAAVLLPRNRETLHRLAMLAERRVASSTTAI
ncbi:SRPBCC family protein [Actinotalea fermentans]|nr:SRPBCC family protein [Actinotalea fermentans]KGM16856.1 polyketide cyclase [Actinotalea fermentans ATCC 43279 = JCM 9966 = DSM 3133]